MTAGSSIWTDLSCQRIKLLCKRHLIFCCHLAFAKHVHQFDTGQHISSRAKGFIVEHRLGNVLDGTMILLDDIVEILDLTNLDRCVPVIIDPIYSSFIGPTFVHRDLLRISVMAHRFFEEPVGCCLIALCRQEKVDGFAFLINSTTA